MIWAEQSSWPDALMLVGFLAFLGFVIWLLITK